MIIYGSRAVHLKSAQSRTIACPSCGTQGAVIISAYRKHAHLFWIPLFPIGKKGVSQCQHCKNTLEAKEMPESIRREYDNLRNEAKGPLWQFAGLGIITALIVWGIYASNKDRELELEYIASPVEGDIYSYEIETGSYSTLKVIGLSNDSVFVSPNGYEINKISKIYKIDKPENYTGSPYGVPRDELKEMYDAGEILDIKR